MVCGHKVKLNIISPSRVARCSFYIATTYDVYGVATNLYMPACMCRVLFFLNNYSLISVIDLCARVKQVYRIERVYLRFDLLGKGREASNRK